MRSNAELLASYKCALILSDTSPLQSSYCERVISRKSLKDDQDRLKQNHWEQKSLQGLYFEYQDNYFS